MQKSSSRAAAGQNKEKPQKLRLSKIADRNANSTSNSPTTTNSTTHSSSNLATTSSQATSQGGTIRKLAHKRSKYDSNEGNINTTGRGREGGGGGGAQRNTGILYQDENYMEFDFFNRDIPNRDVPQFTELFRDFPVSYATTTLAMQSSTLPNKPPPYRDPPPPTPPPLSQLPSRNLRNTEVTQSCPSTPFRGKVVLSKKERKELSKLSKLQDTATSNSTSNIRGFDINDTAASSVQSSPYKGRVTELKNCIARINSKGLFASLHRSSTKSLNTTQHQPSNEEQTNSSNEISPPPPAPETSPPGSNASNNNDVDYTEKLKNLPVRQRKANTSHMDNYCLFDPMDFVNEKALRRRTHDSLNIEIPLPQQQQGLRDPLFSSRQNLDFSEEELVPEVIYGEENNEEEEEEEEDEPKPQRKPHNFDHHNYFVIDPDDFEEEPLHDIGIPNPYTNEQLVQANLIANQHTYANNPEHFKTSESLEKLLKAFETAPSMSNSQESKDTTTLSTTTTSTALVESSTSTNSNTSSTSNTSSQTTLQRTKKKLTFLNLSPFRSQKSSTSNSSAKNDKHQERAVSELVTSEHMFRLQRMLLSADNVLTDTRPINENIELNYVLFNPGPVPSRNVQYKIRKPRPVSTHSDADSGFLSPCSPDEFSTLKFNPALLVLQQCDSVQGYIECILSQPLVKDSESLRNACHEFERILYHIAKHARDMSEQILLDEIIKDNYTKGISAFKQQASEFIEKFNSYRHESGIEELDKILEIFAEPAWTYVHRNDMKRNEIIMDVLRKYKVQELYDEKSNVQNSHACPVPGFDETLEEIFYNVRVLKDIVYNELKSARNIGELLLQDAAIFDNNDPVVYEFKKNISEFVEQYNSYNPHKDSIEQILSILEIYTETKKLHMEIPQENMTADNQMIMNALENYEAGQFEEQLKNKLDNEFNEDYLQTIVRNIYLSPELR